MLACAALAVLVSCGHKLPLTLAPYAAPGPPENLAAVQREDIMTLSWSYRQSERIKGFLIMRKSPGRIPGCPVSGPLSGTTPAKAAPGGVFKKIAFVTGTTYSGRLIFGNVYTYQVRAETTTGVLGTPALISVPALVPPPPPEGIHFAIGNSLLTLGWKAEGTWNGRQVFYNVYGGAAKPKAALPLLNAVPIGRNSFSFAPRPAEDMIYRVKALLGGPFVYEGKGASVIVRPRDFVPSRPERPETVVVPGGIRLIWQPNPETWVSGYRVYRMKGTIPVKIGSSTVPTFFDKGASSGTYRISAVGSVAQSPLSEPSTVP
ncbi:MAG: hypothetical protein M0Z58_03835 [Nitrospiraceae bacterium]|nr:hypothetical protein [Nitrospiraceae bacterium]